MTSYCSSHVITSCHRLKLKVEKYMEVPAGVAWWELFLWRIGSAASEADRLISVCGLCRRWSTVHSSPTFTFTCAAPRLISGVFTVCVGSYINTSESLLIFFFLCSCRAAGPSSSAALGGNRLAYQWIKPTDKPAGNPRRPRLSQGAPELSERKME